MKYRIADKIIFDSESDWIVCRDGDSVLAEKKLTKTAAQILTILLSNYGELVERDYLLSEVWETRGHHGSNSSLNQYISILRKTLNEMGIPKDCIVSEPKKGFFFSRAVDVSAVSPHDILLHDTTPTVEVAYPVVVSPEPAGKVTTHLIRAKRNYAINIVLGMLIAITLLACFFELDKMQGISDNHEPVKLFSLQKCQVLSDTDNYVAYQQVMKEIIYDIHPDIEKQCSSENMQVFIRVQPSIFFEHAGRVFIAICAAKAENNELTYCENNYRFNYTHHREQ